MTEINIESDLNLVCVRTKSFSQGIEEAFNPENKIPNQQERECYGIYEENKSGIIYRAGMSKKDNNEDVEYGLENYTIKKGEYLTVIINDWKNNIPKIGQTFDKIAKSQPAILRII